MNRKLLVLVCVALGLIAAGGTQTTSVATLERQASVDIVGQDQGLIAVEQTITGYNETRETANVSVTVTNQGEIGISSVVIEVGDKTQSTTPLSSGHTETVHYFDVRCDSTIQSMYTTKDVELRMTSSVACQ